ncbi:glycosyltransferase family 4 protein [Patescibacteria group bacterium]|nr:glycosyltransferase family 4 protein [Patescibacteria group bacterium]
MKIGIVTPYYYPVLGGVTEHVYYSYQELKKLGHQVTIITSNFMGENYDRGARVIRVGRNIPLPIPMNGSFPKINLGPDVGNRLKKISKQEKFDLVHIHSPLAPVLPFVALKMIKGIPKVGTFHTYGRQSMLYQLFREPIKFFDRELNGRIAVSKAAKEFISQYFPGDYKIIPNGVDVNRFHPEVESANQLADGCFNILFVGRMDPRKGLNYLISAFPLIKKQIKNARLIVAGGGRLNRVYKSQAELPGPQDIVFTGRVSYDDLPKYYKTADVFCSPATGGESFGIVLLEAMASGTPVVASNIEGYKDVITDSQDGLLSKNRNPQDLADKIISIWRDKKLAAKLKANGRKTAQKYAWPKVTKQIAAYYQQIVADYRAK